MAPVAKLLETNNHSQLLIPISLNQLSSVTSGHPLPEITKVAFTAKLSKMKASIWQNGHNGLLDATHSRHDNCWLPITLVVLMSPCQWAAICGWWPSNEKRSQNGLLDATLDLKTAVKLGQWTLSKINLQPLRCAHLSNKPPKSNSSLLDCYWIF